MSNNPQFRRTDKAIMQALISILKRKPFEKVTIQDILDETPVTRATFYAHYKDKYDIAEKMMDHFLNTRTFLRNHRESDPQSHERLLKSVRIDPDFMNALLKIHTEKVDFRRIMGAELEKEYLASSTSPNREIEARIYGQAYVEFYISLHSKGVTEQIPPFLYSVMLPVAAKLLNLEQDQETLDFLRAKIEKLSLSGK